MNFWPDFIKLKTSIGGNREHYHYEESFGMPIEEKMHITVPNKQNKRILSELELAIRLNEVNDYQFDVCIKTTLDYLLEKMAADGVLTASVCHEAEQMLMPCAKMAKEYKLILAGHAHIDMDWMWSYQETVAITLSTFRTVLNLMKQYPDFCFSQSQASVYKIVEEYDEEMKEEIQERIREGRWEVTASAWVETDKNMPNTESLLRHIQYTKHYLSEHWGIDADKLEIDFSPDTFGHNANVPELDAFGGLKYMYHCRALDGDQSLYRFKSPSGKELLVYREQYWYNSAIVPKVGLGLIDISKTCAGFKTGLIVYGVGDHGGGPTRRDIENAIDMSTWPIWPTMKFGTFREFFKEAESVREQLPVIDHELNYFATGCYTTQTRIKRGNRKSEAILMDAEKWMAFAGTSYKKEKHEQAWQNVLYNHFHDIITGSCVQDSRENAMAQFSRAMAYAQTQYGKATTTIASMIDTSSIETDAEIGLTQSEGAGGGFNMGSNLGLGNPQGMAFNIGFNNGVPNPERGCGKVRIFNIFNPTTTTRKAVTELTVWDWVGDIRRVQFKDAKGNVFRHQMVDNQYQWYWDHQFLRILVEAEVPAMGYTTVVMSESEASSYSVYRQSAKRSEYPFDNYVLENEFVRAEFSSMTGCLISYVDKETGIEYIDNKKSAGLSVITLDRSSTDAWKIGRYLKEEHLSNAIHIESIPGGELQNGFTATYQWGNSTMKVTPMLQTGEKAIRFCVNVDWNEVSGKDVTYLLVFQVPMKEKSKQFICDVPGGVQYRKPVNHDIPGLQFCAGVKEDGSALALIPDSKYGYRVTEDTLAVSLINTANYPDPYPDRGLHVVNIALAIAKNSPKELEDIASSYNHPTYFISNNSHQGVLPMDMSFIQFIAKSSVLSAVLPTAQSLENAKEFHVRFYEMEGNEDKVVLKFKETPIKAWCVDLSGKEIESDIQIEGLEVSVSVKPYTIGEVKVVLGGI